MRQTRGELRAAAAPPPRGPVISSRRHRTVWIAAPLKTGSTWLSYIMSQLLRWQDQSVAPNRGRREQEITVGRMFLECRENVFLPHTHTKATDTTVDFVVEYDVDVIIPHRNMFDTVVSVRDHLTNYGVHIPPAFIPVSFRSAPKDEQYNIITELIVPWYVNFYASWGYSMAQHPLRVSFVQYESMLQDPHQCIAQILRNISVERSPDSIKSAIIAASHAGTRYNIGKKGRGLTELDEMQRTRIASKFSVHTDPIIVEFFNKLDLFAYHNEPPNKQTTGGDAEAAAPDTSEKEGSGI
jgi:hypothetical protein